MKKFKIGELEVSMCENIEDMNMNRYTAFEGQMIRQETGREPSSMLKLYQDIMQEFDKDKSSGMLIRIHEEIVSIKHTIEMDEANQIMFALMTLEDGELAHVTDKNILKEKLQRFAVAGLTQGVIVKEVSNFIRVLANS
jgi:hypothetical protein